jgi:hypothetical protein
MERDQHDEERLAESQFSARRQPKIEVDAGDGHGDEQQNAACGV